jgi:cold shock CspA family protein
MGRSSETFNKKEKEKKRLKKQQEKKEKAELRKAGSDKGKGLEDMMAYVDENGNITSTPPDRSKAPKLIQAEDIVISIAKRTDDPEDDRRSGVISFFNTAKGYGFIRDSETRENIFFHVNSLGYDAKENDKVSFATERGPKGMNAVQVTKI